jgi:carboxymethylenebutenolidase
VKAAVPYYGGGITNGQSPVRSPEPAKSNALCICFSARRTQLIRWIRSVKINTELTTKKVPFQMKIYPDAGHGFFCDERGSYHEASAKDAWEKTKSFFALSILNRRGTTTNLGGREEIAFPLPFLFFQR